MKDIFQKFFDYKLNFNMTNEEFEKVKKFVYQISEFLFNLGAKNVFPTY